MAREPRRAATRLSASSFSASARARRRASSSGYTRARALQDVRRRRCVGCDAGYAWAGYERVWVCEVCELAPAAVTCKANAATLCDADIDTSNPLSRRHEHVPVQPIGTPSSDQDAALVMSFRVQEK
ncbi:hypothetical protein ACQ4PT_005937 [Festuca glaucescens]